MNEIYLSGNIKNGIITTERRSGKKDSIPVTFNHSDIITEDKMCAIEGSLRSKNINGRVDIYVEVKSIDIFENYNSDCFIKGFICKKGQLRCKNNKTILDAILAVNDNNSVDYIPCIFWNKLATEIKDIDIGTELSVRGILQSREYISGRTKEKKTTYEVSVLEILARR